MSFLDGVDRNLVCLIDTGTYTGDGTLSQAITGVGFAPKYVATRYRPVAEDVNVVFGKTMIKTDQTFGDLGFATDSRVYDNRLISLDADGFTVDDDGADEHPNKDGQVYEYICLG